MRVIRLRCCPDEISAVLGCGVLSLGDKCPTFRDSPVVSFSQSVSYRADDADSATFVHHKLHIDRARFEPKTPRLEAGDKPP